MKRSQGKKSRKNNYLALLLVLGVILGGGIFLYYNLMDILYAPTPVGPDLPSEANRSLASTDAHESFGDIKLHAVDLQKVQSNHLLALVNWENGIRENATFPTVPASPQVPVRNTDIRLNQTALQALEQLFSSANKEGYYNLFLNSGYRSAEKQKQLYQEAEDKSYVQKPNYSEHQTGLAADIAIKGLTGSQMDNARESKWLHDNVFQYGFILRYPEDKQELTNVPYEPWHFRYIGLAHAHFCSENNLVLEEYLDFLKEKGGYTISIDGNRYHVIYQKPKGKKIKVPKNQDYEISADNKGGYVITVVESRPI